MRAGFRLISVGLEDSTRTCYMPPVASQNGVCPAHRPAIAIGHDAVSSNSRPLFEVGFIDIADVEKVEALLRQVLQLGPPASKDVD